MMPRPGDIYWSEKVEGDPTSGHWWILLYVGVDEVRYMTATSQIESFVYRWNVKGKLRQPKRHPDSAVFLDTEKIVGLNKSPIFSKPTILNCHHSPSRIPLNTFNLRVEHSNLERVGRLPDRYLAQIIPFARGCGAWTFDAVRQLLDTTSGIGGRIDAFYSALRQ